MDLTELEKYEAHIRGQLSKLSPLLQKYALGDFSESIEIPDEENEFTELLVGLSLMVDDLKEMIQEKEGIIKELEETKEKLSSFFGNTKDLVTIVDTSGELTYANNTSRSIFGLDPEEAIGRIAFEFIHEDDKQSTQEAFARWLKEKKTNVSYENRQVAVDGSVRDLLWTIMLRYDTDGNPESFWSVGRDITKRKKIEDELKESEEKLNDLYNNAPDMFVSVEPKTASILKCNRTLCEATGYSKEEIIGRPIFEMYHPDSLERAHESFNSFVETGVVKDKELQLMKKDGSPIDVSLNVTSVRDDDGNILHSNSSWRDISHQKKIREELHLKNIVFKSSIAGNSISNASGEIMHANQAFLDQWGYDSFDEVTGKLISEFMADQNEAGPIIQSLMGVGKWEGEFTGLRKNGSTFISRGLATTILDTQGEIVGFQSANLDVTKEIEADEELKETMQELEKSNKELEQFAYIASHDLQEPLRKVKSFSELFAKKYHDQLDEKAEKYLSYIVGGTNRMQGLLNDLLTFSRVSTRGKELISTACDDILRRALDNLEISIKETEATITHDPLPYARVDRGQLTQVFQNLLSNAIKFHSEEAPRIHISCKDDGDCWEFRVRDNGIGIDMDQSDRIFQVFQRLHSRTAYPGTGIGLAIVKKIIERHGGRIWVESEPGKGSVFGFTIPSSTEQEVVEEVVEEEVEVVEEEHGQRGNE